MPEAQPLLRAKTAPPEILSRFLTNGTASSPAETLPPYGEQQSAVTTESPRAATADDEPVPWVLRRELSERRESDRWDSFSAVDVSRALLEKKLRGTSSTHGSTASIAEQEPKLGRHIRVEIGSDLSSNDFGSVAD